MMDEEIIEKIVRILLVLVVLVAVVVIGMLIYYIATPAPTTTYIITEIPQKVIG